MSEAETTTTTTTTTTSTTTTESAVPETTPAPTQETGSGLGEDAREVLRAIVAAGDVNTLTRRTAFAQLAARLAARPGETRSEAEIAQLVEREKEALRRVFDAAATELEEAAARDEQEKKRIAQSELFGDDIVMPSEEPAPKRVRRDDDGDDDDDDDDENDDEKKDRDGKGEKKGKESQEDADEDEDRQKKGKKRHRKHRHHHSRHSSSSEEEEEDSDEDYQEKDGKKSGNEQQDDASDDNEDEEEESKRKRRKSGGTRRHRKRGGSSEGEGEGEGDGGARARRGRKEPARASRAPKEELTEEDALRETIFRPKRKKQQKMSDEEKRDAATVFVTRMNRAFRDDKISVQQRRPAVAKMQMLGEVECQLQNSGMTEAFLECGVLRAIAAWLTPVKVGRKTFLPNVELRTRLVKLLSTIEFDPEAHLNDGIGYAINVLYQSPEETTENKFIEHKLIDDWLRKLHDIPATIQYNHTVAARDDEAEEVPAGQDDYEPMRTAL